MAAGSEVPTHGPLNIGYGFSPSVYQPQSIAVPQGAGALWAGVGKTALDAGAAIQSAAQALQQSPVNPAVKAKQNYDVSQFKYGQDVIQHARDTGDYGWLRARATPSGSEVLAPAETGASFAPLFQPKKTEEQKAGEPPTPEHAPGTGSEPLRKEEKPEQKDPKAVDPEHPENFDAGGAPPATNIALNTLVPSKGGSTAALTAGGTGQLNTGQPQDPDVVATPAQPPAPQPSSIWTPGRPTPLAPPAPGPAPAPAPAPAQPAQGQSPAAATMADQANMAKWRAQNEHPVMSSQDALGWMKNFDTGVKRATYLPMGGPGGSPAFAFHMDGGGINTVPVSQMAQKGGGPLIASQNTSQVISSTDQAQQGQQQAAQNQPNISPPPPANLPQTDQPNISPPPPANLPQMPPTGQVSGAPTGTAAQPWGPPPAPTGPQVAQAPTQYPNISGPPPAPVTGAYDPTPYRQGIAQAMAQPGNLMAQERSQAGVRSTDTPPVTVRPTAQAEPLSEEDQRVFTPEAIAAARARAPLPNQPRNATNSDGSGGDPSVGPLGNWQLYRDDTNRIGELYAIRPGLSSLFKQQRYYLGSDGWREYELPDTNMRLNMEAEYGGNAKGGVAGTPAPKTGKPFPTFSNTQIANMSTEAMKGWLAKAAAQHNTDGSTPNADAQQILKTKSEASRSIQRLLDMAELARKMHMTPAQYNKGELDYNEHAGKYEGLVPPEGWPKDAQEIMWGPGATPDPNWFGRLGRLGHAGQAAIEATQAGGHTYNPLLAAMDEEARRLKSQLIQVKGIQDILPESQEEKDLPVRLSGGFGAASGELDTKIPLTVAQKSVYNAVNRLFQGGQSGSQQDVINGLKQLQQRLNHEYVTSYEDAANHRYRLNSTDVYDYHKIQNGERLEDKENIFRDGTGQISNPYKGWTTPMPQISKYDTKEFERLGIEKGDHYLSPDGKTTLIRQ